MARAEMAKTRLPEGEPQRGQSALPRWRGSAWLKCSPATPWGVHGRIVEDRCTRCGWEA